ncbi:MAG: Holliday junction resolvase RuvX [Gemmatimonadetes bacterium]|nr:Holliday junction resolvase RuvX [Gemmatimonadota bacterium]
MNPGFEPPRGGAEARLPSTMNASTTEPGAVLAIDPGVRRFGVALSDPTRTLATPLTTLVRRKGKRAPVAAIEALVREHCVVAVIVGLPDGREGADLAWIDEIRRFAETLRTRTGLPVHLHDESYSTVEALSKLNEAQQTTRGEKGRIDAAAATVILQDWLDEHAKSD